MITIGYHMIILRKCKRWFGNKKIFNIIDDCKDAQDELLGEIKEARKFLSSKGMKFDTK